MGSKVYFRMIPCERRMCNNNLIRYIPVSKREDHCLYSIFLFIFEKMNFQDLWNLVFGLSLWPSLSKPQWIVFLAKLSIAWSCVNDPERYLWQSKEWQLSNSVFFYILMFILQVSYKNLQNIEISFTNKICCMLSNIWRYDMTGYQRYLFHLVNVAWIIFVSHFQISINWSCFNDSEGPVVVKQCILTAVHF